MRYKRKEVVVTSDLFGFGFLLFDCDESPLHLLPPPHLNHGGRLTDRTHSTVKEWLL